MSDLAQAALISGIIFTVVVLRGYGRRHFDRRAVLFPLLMTGGFGFAYLAHMPVDTTGDVAAYAVAIVLGLGFGWLASTVTAVERDEDNHIIAIAGPAFVAIWGAAVAIRLLFVWAVSDWSWARMHFGEFMIGHHISFDAIAPFFVLWALTMVLVRLVAVGVRGARQVRSDAASRPASVMASASATASEPTM